MTTPTEQLARELAAELGDAATVEIQDHDLGTIVTIEPVDPAARSVSWMAFRYGGEVVLQIGEVFARGRSE